MSKSLKGKIFYYTSVFPEAEVYFYKVSRATTNTCEVVALKKSIVSQTGSYQLVAPDTTSEGAKHRCKVLDLNHIEMASGQTAVYWDGSPIRQATRIIITPYGF
tara:strand:- start:325 stop:636 length:312 start_codon:yes stop_codon:yes gene_type:complete